MREFIAKIGVLLGEAANPEEFLHGFIALVGGDPSRLPVPLPAPLLQAASVQMHGRWPWEAVIPLTQLAALECPKLVVSGGHSAMFDAVCDAIESGIHARRVVIPGAGHSIPLRGDLFNEEGMSPRRACIAIHWRVSPSRRFAPRSPSA